MATIITDLKNTFRRGNIYLQLIYINVGVFILTTLTEVILQLFNRSLAGVFEWMELPASLSRFIIQPWSIQYALVVLVRCIVSEFFFDKASAGYIYSRRDLWRCTLYSGLQHFPLFPSHDRIFFHVGCVSFRTCHCYRNRLS